MVAIHDLLIGLELEGNVEQKVTASCLETACMPYPVKFCTSSPEMKFLQLTKLLLPIDLQNDERIANLPLSRSFFQVTLYNFVRSFEFANTVDFIKV